MLDKKEILDTINEFFEIEIEATIFHRFGRNRDFFTDTKLQILQDKCQRFFNHEMGENDFRVFKKSYGHFFTSPFYLKRAIHIIKRLLRQCGYELDFYGFPVRKMIIISNMTVENPIVIPRKNRKDKPKGFTIEHRDVLISFGVKQENS